MLDKNETDNMDMKKPLIAAYVLDGKGGGQAIDWDGINNWSESDGVLWVHMDYTTEQAENWLKQDSGVDEMISAALLSDEPRPRSMVMFDGLLVILRGVNLNPGADPEDMVSIRIWMNESRIISTRRRKLLSISDMCKAIDQGVGPVNSGEFLVQISERMVDRMSDVVSAIDDKMDLIEDQILGEKNYQMRSKIAELRRETISLRRYLAPQRESMMRLYNEKAVWLSDIDRLHLREVADSTMRYVEDLDMVREKAIVIQEELMSGLSEQMDKRMYVLSIVAAIFLPLGFFTGLLGINVGGIPGADYKGAFVIFCVLLSVVVVLQLWLFKKMKWM